MMKKVPINYTLYIDCNIEWKEHFPAPTDLGTEAISLQSINPYPNLETILNLCCDSYNDIPNEDIIPKDWIRFWSVSSTKSGYFGSIYGNAFVKQIVVAHRGTKLTNMGAWKANTAIFFNEYSSQMSSAMTCSYQLKEKMRTLFPGWTLIIIGHSLGSYLTDVNLFSLMYLEPDETCKAFCKRNDAENSKVIEILPYAIGIDGPGNAFVFYDCVNLSERIFLGSFEMLEKLRDENDVRYRDGDRLRIEDLPVDHYLSVPNIVNTANRQSGGAFQIPMVESSDCRQISIFGKILKLLDNLAGKKSTHPIDGFVLAWHRMDESSIKKILDWPANTSERLKVNLNSNSDSRIPEEADGAHASERYQVKPINLLEVELRFFSDYAKRFIYHIDAMKRYTSSQIEFLIENVASDDRQLVLSILKSVDVDADKGIIICREEGMYKQKFIPWLNALFTLYPNFIEKEIVIWSMYRQIFQRKKWLEFNCDPLDLKFDAESRHTVKSVRNTSIAMEEHVASLDFWQKKYIAVKASQIRLMEKLFKFEDNMQHDEIIVIEQDIEEFALCINLRHLRTITIKYDSNAPGEAPVTCKVDNLTDDCKSRLLSSTLIDCQGTQLKLNDFVSELNDSVLHSLLQGGLKQIPKWKQLDPSNIYFERGLITTAELSEIFKKLRSPRDQIPLFNTQAIIPKEVIENTITNFDCFESKKIVPICAVNETNSKVILLSDGPGTGKTTLLTMLCSVLKSKYTWVVRVNLNERPDIIHEWAGRELTIRESKPEDLLSELVDFDLLLKPLLRGVMQDEGTPVKICILFDALDEVKAVYDQLIIDLIKQLQNCSKICKIIVSTRPHLKDKLESSLRTNSFSFYPFNNDEQVEIITELMAHSGYDISVVENLFAKLYLWIDAPVRGTPMMLQLLAEKFNELKEDSNHYLSVHSIYVGHVMHTIREHVLVKDGASKNSQIAENNQETYLNLRFLDIYYYYAIKQILALKDSEIVNDFGIKGPTESEKNTILSHGIIVGSNYLFKHKTFAEFFLAKWVMSDDSRLKMRSGRMSKIFLKILTSIDHETTRMFMEGEAQHRYSTGDEKVKDYEEDFFKELANELLIDGNRDEQDVFSLNQPKLTRHVFDGIKKFCDEKLLQDILLSPTEITLFHSCMNVDEAEQIMAMYNDSGLVGSGRMPSILKSITSEGNILHLLSRTPFASVQSKMFQWLRTYLSVDEIRELLKPKATDHSNALFRKVPGDEQSLCEVLKWHIEVLTDIELKNVIESTDNDNQSVWLMYPHIVHKTLKEMKPNVLNLLKNLFEASEKKSVWEHLLSEEFGDYAEKLNYVYDEIFVDQNGSDVAEAFKAQVLDHKPKASSVLKQAAIRIHSDATVVAVLFEIANKSGISHEVLDSVANDIMNDMQCTEGLDYLLLVFVKLGLYDGVIKLLEGVHVKNHPRDFVHTTRCHCFDSNIYIANVNVKDDKGRTILQIADMYDTDYHRAIAETLRDLYKGEV